jgi:hypothetical protein
MGAVDADVDRFSRYPLPPLGPNGIITLARNFRQGNYPLTVGMDI